MVWRPKARAGAAGELRGGGGVWGRTRSLFISYASASSSRKWCWIRQTRGTNVVFTKYSARTWRWWRSDPTRGPDVVFSTGSSKLLLGKSELDPQAPISFPSSKISSVAKHPVQELLQLIEEFW